MPMAVFTNFFPIRLKQLAFDCIIYKFIDNNEDKIVTQIKINLHDFILFDNSPFILFNSSKLERHLFLS